MKERILQGDIKEYKRIIVVPRDEDSMECECCITRQKTTGIQLLRQCREEYNVCVSEDVKTDVSLTEEGTDSYLKCLAASGYAIVISLIFEQSGKPTQTSSWAYLPTELSKRHRDGLRSYLSQEGVTNIDATYFVSLEDGEAKMQPDMFQKDLPIDTFPEMLDEPKHKRLERRQTNPTSNPKA